MVIAKIPAGDQLAGFLSELMGVLDEAVWRWVHHDSLIVFGKVLGIGPGSREIKAPSRRLGPWKLVITESGRPDPRNRM
jgi:hypothetical protein